MADESGSGNPIKWIFFAVIVIGGFFGLQDELFEAKGLMAFFNWALFLGICAFIFWMVKNGGT